MDPKEIIAQAMGIINDSGSSGLTKSICRNLFEQSQLLTQNVGTVFVEKTVSTGHNLLLMSVFDVNDLNGEITRLNQTLKKLGSDMELHSGIGKFDNGEFVEVTSSNGTFWTSFWLCRPGEGQQPAIVETSYDAFREK